MSLNDEEECCIRVTQNANLCARTAILDKPREAQINFSSSHLNIRSIK